MDDLYNDILSSVEQFEDDIIDVDHAPQQYREGLKRIADNKLYEKIQKLVVKHRDV